MPAVTNMMYHEPNWSITGPYTGEVNAERRPHGNGRITDTSNARFYDGMWENGVMRQGILGIGDESIYDGSFDSNADFVHGKYTYPDGQSYTGPYSGGFRNGIGMFDYLYCKYIGTFRNDERNGAGIVVFTDKVRFLEGDWVNGYVTRGKFTDDGTVYNGTWSGDRATPAIGTITWPNGVVADVVNGCCIITTYEQYMTVCMMNKTEQECNLETDPIFSEPFVVTVNGQPRLVAPLL